MNEEDRITVNGVEYIRADKVNEIKMAEKFDGLEYCMVRAASAGVFAGYVKSRAHDEAVLLNARRIWYWEGAASLSELAVRGTSNPSGCKFPVAVPKVTLIGVIEIIPISDAAAKSIAEVPVWTK